jgi:hypothetical protein
LKNQWEFVIQPKPAVKRQAKYKKTPTAGVGAKQKNTLPVVKQ